MASIATRVDKLEALYGAGSTNHFRLSLIVDGATDGEVERFARQHGYDPDNKGHALIRLNIVDPAGVAPLHDGPKIVVLH